VKGSEPLRLAALKSACAGLPSHGFDPLIRMSISKRGTQPSISTNIFAVDTAFGPWHYNSDFQAGAIIVRARKLDHDRHRARGKVHTFHYLNRANFKSMSTTTPAASAVPGPFFAVLLPNLRSPRSPSSTSPASFPKTFHLAKRSRWKSEKHVEKLGSSMLQTTTFQTKSSQRHLAW